MGSRADSTGRPRASDPSATREDSIVPHTLVTFHAHPDDEAIATAGVMAKAASEGHRVVLVVATRGEHAGFGHQMLEPREKVSERGVQEPLRAAQSPGVSRAA